MADPDAQIHRIELNRVPIVFDLERGSLSFFGLSSALFWTDPSLLKLLQPLAEEVGQELFRLLVAHSSSHGTDQDYHAMVNTLGETFAEGFLAWGDAVSVAGWGRFKLPVFDAERKVATVVIDNPWELEMQRDLPLEERWGCPFLMGKVIGIFTHALGTTCWADEDTHVEPGANRVTFSVYPSTKTIPNELGHLRRTRMRARERLLAEQVERKTAELHQAQRRLERHSEELELRVQERTAELRQAHGRLVQSEKIAALGQVVAGVAHEINNPLGAISATATNVQDVLQQLPHDFAQLLQWCSDPALFELTVDLVKVLGRPREFLDFRERRRLRAAHEQALRAHALPHVEEIAEELVHLGLQGDLERWLPVLRHPHALGILGVVGRVSLVSAGIGDIARAVTRASKIVFSLGRYAHKDRHGHPTEQSLQEGLETVLTLYHHLLKYGITVECEFESLPPLRGFHDELNQVWTNLIQNAVHAMQGKGTLRLRLFAGDDGRQVVTVQDSGGGIPPEVVARIFEPFFTTKPAGEGTGLGLPICHQIVTRHHGTLAIDSEPGHGTTVRVELPLDPPAEPVSTADSASSQEQPS